MVALRDFENKEFGKIIKGQIIPQRVLKNMDIKSLEASGLIAEEKKLVIKKVNKK